MSVQDILEYRVERLEKVNDKQSELIEKIATQVTIMQTKFIVLGVLGSSVVAGAVSLAFKLLGGNQ